MGRRPRHVRRSMRAEPYEVISYRLLGPGQHEGSAAEDGPEKDLEPPIPADVVKRAPHDVGALSQGAADGRRQAGEAVHEHFRRAGRAGGEEHPLRGNLEFGIWNLEFWRWGLNSEF